MPSSEEVVTACGMCGETIPEGSAENAVRDVSGSVCESCFDNETFICHDCDSAVVSQDGSYGFSGTDITVCETCYRDTGGFCCNGCDQTFRGAYYGGDGFCESCFEPEEEERDEDDEEETSSNIRNHSFRVEKILPFKGGPAIPPNKPVLYMGVELEVEVKDGDRGKCSGIVNKALDNFAVLKEDGSINYGFEIVSAPATFEFHKSGVGPGISEPVAPWESFFELRKTTLKGLRSFDTDTCGMHIHMSRNALTKLQTSKMNVFLNDPLNTAFVHTIAGRTEERWCKVSKKKHTDTYQLIRDMNFDRLTRCPECGSDSKFESGPGFWVCSNEGCCQSDLVQPKPGPDGKPAYVLRVNGHGTKSGDDRYQALNLTNEKTVEIRIFKGTLNKASFFKNIEFAHAIAMFCGDSPAHIVDKNGKLVAPDHTAFCKWLDKSQRRVYPNLTKFLEHRKFIPKREVKPIDMSKIPAKTPAAITNKLKENAKNVFDYQETC